MQIYIQYKNSPEYLKLIMRYYLALKRVMDLYGSYLNNASANVFYSLYN